MSRKIELPYELEQKIILFYKQPNSIAATAKFFNQTSHTITLILNKYGVARHSKEILDAIQTSRRNKTCLEKYGYKCSLQNPAVKQRRDRTMLSKYGVKYSGQSSVLREKQKSTCAHRYGVDYASQSSEIKDKIRQTNNARYGTDYFMQTAEFKERVKATSRARYGVDYYLQSQEFRERSKQTCLQKYGVEYSFQSENNKQKSLMSKKQNKTMSSSGFERDFESFLITNQIAYETQYKSCKYPFHCDFYLPKTDMYIELNLSWTHGNHFFDPNSIEDLAILQKWKKCAETSDYYKSAIDVWTRRDLDKLRVAQDNKLNYICIFGAEEIPRLQNRILMEEKGVT